MANEKERTIENNSEETSETNSKLTFKPYGTDSELDKLVDSTDISDHIKAAELDYGIDKLLDDKSTEVREILDKKDYTFDTLPVDIRRTLAQKGYGLDKLLKDSDQSVRQVVAYKGYGLDELMNDPNPQVRAAAIEQQSRFAATHTNEPPKIKNSDNNSTASSDNISDNISDNTSDNKPQNTDVQDDIFQESGSNLSDLENSNKQKSDNQDNNTPDNQSNKSDDKDKKNNDKSLLPTNAGNKFKIKRRVAKETAGQASHAIVRKMHMAKPLIAAKKTAKGTVKAGKGLKNYGKNFKQATNKKQFIKNSAKNGGRNIKNGVKNGAKKAYDKASNTKAWKTAAKVVKFIYTYATSFGIFTLVIVLVYHLVIFGISVAQSIDKTPHYYCDTDASKSVKNSAVYKQYCKTHEQNWGVKNINGHYIVQDGKDEELETYCAVMNMTLRFYTIDTDDFEFGTTNVYKYLWQADGQYTSDGNTVANTAGQNNTVRQLLNNNTTQINTKQNNGEIENASQWFAAKQGKNNFTMSNWGYLRDDSIDYKNWQLTSDYYENQTANGKWVWDLSIDNQAAGSSWPEISFTNTSIRFDVTKVIFNEIYPDTTDTDNYKYTKDTMNFLVSEEGNSQKDDEWMGEYYKGSAGFVLVYNVTKSNGETSKHSVLITSKGNFNGSTYWFGVDSKKCITGGYEGPLDGTGRFVKDDANISQLLNSNNGTYTNTEATYKIEKIIYCTHNKFAWF